MPVHVVGAVSSGRSEIDIWLPLTRALPISTRWPAASVTVMVLKAGSSFCVNHSVTRAGSCDLVADARLGVVEHGVGLRSPVAKQSSSGTIPNER